jgi:hypothetical protein
MSRVDTHSHVARSRRGPGEQIPAQTLATHDGGNAPDHGASLDKMSLVEFCDYIMWPATVPQYMRALLDWYETHPDARLILSMR